MSSEHPDDKFIILDAMTYAGNHKHLINFRKKIQIFIS